MGRAARTLYLEELHELVQASEKHLVDLTELWERATERSDIDHLALRILNTKTALRKIRLLRDDRTVAPSGNVGRLRRAEDVSPTSFVSDYNNLPKDTSETQTTTETGE